MRRVLWRAMVDRLERLTNLVLLLRGGTPRSLREIGDSVPGYPPEGEARRQAFERDKRTLRGGGVEITTVPVSGRDQVGYMIRTEDFYLPDLELDADEQAALNLAVAGVHLGDPSGRDALWRLGLPASAGAQPIAQLPDLPALPILHAALRSHSTVTFTYRGESRRVDPALLRFRAGWWYVIGFDLDKESARTFRVDRIEGVPVGGPPGSAQLRPDFDASGELPDAPWMIGEAEPVPVEVLVDAKLAQLVVAELGEATTSGSETDGSVRVRLEVTNVPALRNWLFELGHHAEVLSPPEVRDEIVDWLETIVGRGEARPRDAAKRRRDSRPRAFSSASHASDPVGAEPTWDTSATRHTGGRVEAGQRLHRLLAVLTWLARSGRAPVSDLAARFGLSAEELVSDLELAACCGLPPYTPDQLMEIIVDENEVVANLGAELARPRRLSPAEGFGLAASARAILAVPGSDPDGALGRALGKLETALGDLGSLRVDLDDPPFLESVRRATSGGQQVRVRYYSASSDEESLRVVDPLDVATLDGRWYLRGYCHKSGGVRLFRVDRISEVEPTGHPTQHHDAPPLGALSSGAVFVPGPDAVLARLRVDAQGSWVTESVPIVSSAARPDGGADVVLGVSSRVWLGRLLLRLGPHATLLEPAELAEVGVLAARNLLDRYKKADKTSRASG